MWEYLNYCLHVKTLSCVLSQVRSANWSSHSLLTLWSCLSLISVVLQCYWLETMPSTSHAEKLWYIKVIDGKAKFSLEMVSAWKVCREQNTDVCWMWAQLFHHMKTRKGWSRWKEKLYFIFGCLACGISTSRNKIDQYALISQFWHKRQLKLLGRRTK